MNYLASVTDFFKSPRWLTNLLLGGLCVLIPFIGPIVLMGWLVTGFWARKEENFETFPDFDFRQFGRNLERGLWPFLVVLLVSMLLVPVLMIFMFPIFLIGTLLADHHGNGNALAGVIFALSIVLLYFLMMAFMALLLAPLKVRASLTQDLVKSFDFGFMKQFIVLTWKETILAFLFLMVASLVLSLAGMLCFCVGLYFAMVPVYFSWTHLNRQLYRVYLERGGEPVGPNPTLREGPPPLPAM